MYVLVISLLLTAFSITSVAQTMGLEQKLERVGNKIYIIENNERFDVSRVITIKLKNGKKISSKEYNIVDSNKLGFIHITVPDSVDIIEYVDNLRSSDIFELVEFNSYTRCNFVPNDPGLSNQWHIDRIGLKNAWNITTGNPGIKVAVIDTGVSATHWDLGYGNDTYRNISTTLGVNYTPASNTHIAPTFNHGTFVAGILGAKTNNSWGISGVAGGNDSSGITIIPYCMGNGQYFDNPSTGNAIIDAVDKGAKVINISLSTSHTTEMDSAIQYAYSNNVSVVCSSGNNNSSVVNYPASHEKTIAVGSIDSYDLRSSFSNYGTALDLVAPGSGIYSLDLNNGFTINSGTSFSAPQVSGTIALMLSVDSTLTPSQIKNILINTSEKLSGYTYSSGWNNETGYGLLKAYNAVYETPILVASRQCTLSGSTRICRDSHEAYTLSGVPSGASVNWSFARTYGTYTPSLYPNASGTTCTIYNFSSTVFEGTLKAEVKVNGYTAATYTKQITGDAAVIGGPSFYWDGLPYEDMYENMLTEDDNYAAYPNVVLVRSPNIYGKTIHLYRSSSPNYTYSPMTRGDDYFTFEMPDLSSGETLNISISGGCSQESVVFYKSNLNYLNIDNTIHVSALANNCYTLSITPEYASFNKNTESIIGSTKKWNIHIYKAEDTRLVLSDNVCGNSYTIETSKWKPGIYIVRAVFNGKVYSTKINVQ